MVGGGGAGAVPPPEDGALTYRTGAGLDGALMMILRVIVRTITTGRFV